MYLLICFFYVVWNGNVYFDHVVVYLYSYISKKDKRPKTNLRNMLIWCLKRRKNVLCRGGSRTIETSKIEHFVIIVVNGWKPLTIITKSSILDAAAVLDPPLLMYVQFSRCVHWDINYFLVHVGPLTWIQTKYTDRVYIFVSILWVFCEYFVSYFISVFRQEINQ